jgi:hypothetical protein
MKESLLANYGPLFDECRLNAPVGQSHFGRNAEIFQKPFGGVSRAGVGIELSRSSRCHPLA